ncbi:putative membrane protein, partial [Yersinia pestis PY-52]
MFLQHLFSAKRRVLLLYLLVISIPIVYYITSRVIEVRNNKLLIKYSELSYHLQQHSIMAKKSNIKSHKKSDPIDIEINKSFK